MTAIGAVFSGLGQSNLHKQTVNTFILDTSSVVFAADAPAASRQHPGEVADPLNSQIVGGSRL